MKTSKVNYKKIEELEEFRIDADYYMPEYLELESIIKNSDTIETLCKTQDLQSNGAFKDIYNILNDGKEKVIPYIRSGNVGDFFVNKNDLEYISNEAHNQLIKTQTKVDDVLMARKGKIGGATIITPDSINFNSNDNVVNIKVKNKKYLNPSYLVTFLNSKYGYGQIERQATGNVQPWLSMYQVRNIKIVVKGYNFQLFIEKLLRKAYIITTESENLYKVSGNLILKDLNLLNWQPKHELSYVKNFSDVSISNRYDAEYFQPKYDEIIEKIKSYSNGWDKLSNIIKAPIKGIEVGSEEYYEQGIPFIRVSNLSQYEINDNNMQYISEKYYNSIANIYQPKKGEILLSKDGTPGIAHYLSEIPQKMIPSGGILRLTINNKEYLPEYLTLVLNSIIVQMQVERVSSGALIKHWLVDEIQNTLIPKLEMPEQIKIVEQINEATKLRKQSKQLLEIAKRGVEIAIEENEAVATSWINEQLSKIGVNI